MLWETSNELAEMHTESVALVARLTTEEMQVWLIGNAEQVGLSGSVIQVRKRGEGEGHTHDNVDMLMMISHIRNIHMIKFVLLHRHHFQTDATLKIFLTPSLIHKNLYEF